jgi:uncharacterized protein
LNYTPPPFLFNPHLETIYPAVFRNVPIPPYTRERITTPDNDFLDLDWLTGQSSKVVVISHGLEGNTQRAYIKGMAKAFYQQGFDILAWNYRGCSEELNRALRFYHSGATDDLATVVQHAQAQGRYHEIYLIGFSLGGNLTLKYLGEERRRPDIIKKAVAFSVPLDLARSSDKISMPSNWIYAQRFLKSLRKKVMLKSQFFNELDTRALSAIKTLREFDDYFTGPLHGFTGAQDYYDRCSSIQFVQRIQVKTLIVNALNDPFLSPECYPYELLSNHPNVCLETPDRGGHVGFTQFNKNGLYWSDQRALEFITARTQ